MFPFFQHHSFSQCDAYKFIQPSNSHCCDAQSSSFLHCPTTGLSLPTLCYIIEIIEIIQYVFSDWLVQLSDMHLRFIHVFWWLDNSFVLLMDGTLLYESTKVRVFDHPCTEEHLGCFDF